jgi:hypothetical protein
MRSHQRLESPLASAPWNRVGAGEYPGAPAASAAALHLGGPRQPADSAPRPRARGIPGRDIGKGWVSKGRLARGHLAPSGAVRHRRSTSIRPEPPLKAVDGWPLYTLVWASGGPRRSVPDPSHGESLDGGRGGRHYASLSERHTWRRAWTCGRETRRATAAMRMRVGVSSCARSRDLPPRALGVLSD